MSGARLRVAVLGAGTVGREVVRALLERPDDLRPADGATLELTAIAVRDVGRAKAAGLPAALLSDAPAHLVADDEIDVIVELMGGDEPAHTLIAAALSMGKSVVTANKHVIAHHGPELEAIARRTGATLRFEAAVGGGIPVLGPARRRSRGEPRQARPRDRQRHDQLHPERDDRRGAPARLRGGPGRGAAAGLRRGRPVGRRRGPRRGQQARHPRPARVRPLAGPGGDRHPARRHRRTGRTRHHDGQPRRPGRRAPGRADHPARGDGVGRRGRRSERGRPADRAPARLGARADRRRAQPDRDRCDAGRARRVRWAGRGRCGDVVGGPGRPDRGRTRGRLDLGPAWCGRRPRRRGRVAPDLRGVRDLGGIRYPIDD